jgi:hypothetical protein
LPAWLEQYTLLLLPLLQALLIELPIMLLLGCSTKSVNRQHCYWCCNSSRKLHWHAGIRRGPTRQ